MDEPRLTVFTARGWGRAPGLEIVDQAATIEWVSLKAVPAAGCPVKHDGFLGWLDKVIAFLRGLMGQHDSPSPTCDPSSDWVQVRVLERLRGEGPTVYRLKDVQREMPDPNFGKTRLGLYPTAALERHRAPAYWDHAPTFHLPRSFVLDGRGYPEADVGLRYLLFRDSRGLTLALEPVAYADDDLLVRLRVYVKGQPFEAPAYGLAAFVREARTAAVVRVTSCERTGRKALKVGAALVSGDPEATRMSWWPEKQSLPDFLWIGDYLDATSQACRPGDRLLILGWTFPEPSANPGFPRAVVIQGGMIRKSALLTGLRLDGPEQIPVSQALAWAAEGRRDLGPNIVTPPTRKDAP